MRPSWFKLAPTLAALALLCGPAAIQAKSLYGRFIDVRAADRLVVQHGTGTYDIHLYGVDPSGLGPADAKAARDFVAALVGDKVCRVRIMDREEGGDEDDMEAQIIVDGRDVALEVLRAGLARREPDVHYKPTLDGQPDDLVSAEDEARLARRGLWKALAGATADGPTGTLGGGGGAVTGANGTVDRNAAKKTGADNECAIAQNPVDPLQLFQACNTSSAGLFAARSVDGGVTWTYPDPADKTIADGDANQGASACCDPTLAWDKFGNLYVTYINASQNTILTLLSTDSGLTFTQIGSVTGLIDQPTVVAADVPGGAAIWVIWNQSDDMVIRGTLATGLGAVGAFPASNQATGASACTFGDVAISPAGAVVQACQSASSGEGPDSIRFNRDADGLGAGGFSTVTTVSATNVGGFDHLPAQNARSVDAEAGLAFDAYPFSPHYGRLYLVYNDETVNENHDFEVLVRYSDDLGDNWSAPIRVNDDATTRSQFLPKIASDPTTGNVTVCWHDARNSVTNVAMEIYCSTALATSSSAPVFGANILVSDGASTSNHGGVEFGDYMGLAFYGGTAHPVWADTSNSTGDNPNGTSNFDAYTDYIVVAPPNALFSDGFEGGTTGQWDGISP